MKIIINNSGKRRVLRVIKTGFFSRVLGLMFKSKNADNLLFEFEKNVKIPFHSLFVFFPFLLLWLNSENKVLEARIVKPFCFGIKPKKSFRKVIEMPFNSKNVRIIEFFILRNNLRDDF